MSKLTSQYQLLTKQLSALLVGENSAITNLSQFTALIYNSLDNVNWSGFYLLVDESNLKLGPFQGQLACSNIQFGKGVCGTAAQTQGSLLVSDIDEFAGHIVCDSRTRSELVCPLIFNGHLIGVFDIDSPELDRFDSRDLRGIQQMLSILSAATDWSNCHQYL